MKIFETLTDFEKIKPGCVLSIGNFDGVHLGHQKILNAAKKIALENSTKLLAMTFEPHPFAILNPKNSPGVLTPLQLKVHLLKSFGVDCLIVLKDSRALLNLSANKFVDEFLVKMVKPVVVVEGDDFNFGSGRDGNVNTLDNLGKEKGFDVRIVKPQTVDLSNCQNQRVSSTLIRNLLIEGNVSDAAVALGRYYRLAGRIITGKGIGKKLGFPTLNMQKPPQIIPAEGVYAGFVQIADTFQQACTSEEKLPAIFSIGKAETFGCEHPINIEAHILTENFQAKTARYFAMDFVKFIRGQQKFDSKTDLAAQIKKDCKTALAILNLSLAQSNGSKFGIRNS